MPRHTLRLVVLLGLVALVLTACGQKRHLQVEGGVGDLDPGTIAQPGEDGDPADQPGEDLPPLDPADDPGDVVDQPGADPGDPAGPPPGGEDPPDPQDPQQPQQPQQQQVQGSDRTGVTDTTLTVAVHAPVSGAAPIPSTSFEQARDLYWRWVTEEQGEQVLGRDSVEVLFADDRYEPSAARQVCRQLADRAFLVIGGGGTDQIQSCGQLAGQARFPYFSAGVTEVGLAGNPWYFAVSMTYPQQGPLLAQYVSSNFGGQKVAAVVTQTQNFNDAAESWESAVAQQGIDYYRTLRHPRGDQSWYTGFVDDLGNAGVKVVYMLTSPLDYIRFATTARDRGFQFQYVGVGVTMGLNDVLGNGCPGVNGGVFFSPFPALELADQIDPNFRRAAQRFNAPSDDIALALWGIAKTQHELFKRYEQTFGTDLTREDFVRMASSAGRIESGVFPPAEFSPNNHFGGRGVHVLRADCSTRTYKDAGTFKSSF